MYFKVRPANIRHQTNVVSLLGSGGIVMHSMGTAAIPISCVPIVFVGKLQHSQQTQNICITFVQHRPNIFDIGPTLYKCYTNVLVCWDAYHDNHLTLLSDLRVSCFWSKLSLILFACYRTLVVYYYQTLVIKRWFWLPIFYSVIYSSSVFLFPHCCWQSKQNIHGYVYK